MTHPSTPRLGLAAIATAGALIAAALAGPAEAQRRHASDRQDFSVPLSRTAGPPLMAVVSLNDQRVTIYDAEGEILQAPVSTGQKGYETPAGIFSILERNREHYSNLYDDAEMPFMQRLTWTGIALHAGVLPGRPASHGCIRMPYGFAEQLFEITKRGMRVVIVRDDMTPVGFAHPNLFKPGPIRSEVVMASAADRTATDAPPMRLGTDEASARARTWRAVAAAKAAAAEEAEKKVQEARKAARKAASEAARYTKGLRQAEAAVRRAERRVEDADHLFGEPNLSPAAAQKVEERNAKAIEGLVAAHAQLYAVKTEAQPLIDAAAAAREAAKDAAAAKVTADNEAKLAEAKLAPVSVFISRKTQRLYVRQAFQPILESPVTIRDPDAPIGTFLYTALGYTGEGGGVRWNALAMYPNPTDPDAGPSRPEQRRRGKQRDAEPTPTDAAAAKAALERVTIPQEAIERINEVLSPGSSLIISDEGLSRETGKGTDFVVVMSGEPQGALKIRKRNPYSSYRYDRYRPRYRDYYSPFSWW
jgi:hypothetical protein